CIASGLRDNGGGCDASDTWTPSVTAMAKPRSRQRGRDSLENELRELNRLYHWDRMRSPSSTSSPRAFGVKAAASNIGSVTKRSRSRRRRRHGTNLSGMDIGDCNDVNLQWSEAWPQQPTAEDTPCLSRPSVGAQGDTAAEAERALLNTYDSAIKTSSDPLLPDDRQTDGSDAKRHHQVATQPPGVSPTPSPDRHLASTAFDAADDPSRASQSPGGVDGDCCSESEEPGTSEHQPAAVAVAFARSFVDGASDGDQEGAADLRAMSSGPGSARGLPGAVLERQQQHGAAVGEAAAIAEGDKSDGDVGGGCGGERRRSVAAVCPEHASSSSSSALGDETVVVVAEGRAAEKETGGDDNVAPTGDPTTGGGDSPVVSAAAAAHSTATDTDGRPEESDGDSSGSESSSSGSDDGIGIGKRGGIFRGQRGRTRMPSKRRVIVEDDSDDDGGGNVHPAEPLNAIASEPSSEEDEEDEEEEEDEEGGEEEEGEGEEVSTGGVASGARLAEACDIIGRATGATSSATEKTSRRPGRRRRVLIDEDSDSSDTGCVVSPAATAAAAATAVADATVSDEHDSPCEVTKAPAVDRHGGLHLAGPRRRKGERAAGAELKQRKPHNESLAQGDVPLELDESSAGGISGADADASAADDEFHPSIGIVPSDNSGGTGSKRTASSGRAGDGYRTVVDEDGCSSGDE
ncbi:unnamed protein product, partial [Ectocarpus sp. 8 AP-2014]